jgi:hypothetical protein
LRRASDGVAPVGQKTRPTPSQPEPNPVESVAVTPQQIASGDDEREALF